jgi:hypothetical protein
MSSSAVLPTPIAASLETDGLSLDLLSKRIAPQDSLHLNVRITGDDAKIFEHLRNRTANITDSLRVRDSVRTAVFLMAMKELNQPVMFKDSTTGEMVEVLTHLGVFYPEEAAKPAKAKKPKRSQETASE